VWASINYTQLISETGGDFTVEWTEGQFISAVGAFGSGIVGLVVPGGPLVGAVAGILFSLIYGGIFTAQANAANEQLVHDQLKKTGKAIIEREDFFASQAETAKAEAADAKSTLQHRIWTVGDLKTIEQLRESAMAQLTAVPKAPPKGDRSLYKKLLRDWVFERSANASGPNKETNEPAFKEARRNAFGVKDNVKLGGLDLFVYQTRHEWSKLGLRGYHEAADELQEQVEKLEDESISLGIREPTEMAEHVMRQLGNVMKFLRVDDSKKAENAFRHVNVNYDANRLNGIEIGCELWLGVDGAAVYVRDFAYYDLNHQIGNRSPT